VSQEIGRAWLELLHCAMRKTAEILWEGLPKPSAGYRLASLRESWHRRSHDGRGGLRLSLLFHCPCP
jgi:hypothetical protein